MTTKGIARRWNVATGEPIGEPISVFRFANRVPLFGRGAADQRGTLAHGVSR